MYKNLLPFFFLLFHTFTTMCLIQELRPITDSESQTPLIQGSDLSPVSKKKKEKRNKNKRIEKAQMVIE